MEQRSQSSGQFVDFTEANYRRLLTLAQSQYPFVSFEHYADVGRCLFWRHDVDMSVHRGLALAHIEAEAGIKATYFIHLHSQFYSVLEPQTAAQLRQIVALGHHIGLHFDPEFYQLESAGAEGFCRYLDFEKKLLEGLVDTQVGVFSLHNPEVGGWLKVDDNVVAGMVNTYGRFFKEGVAYCSDSNGYWRFRCLEEVLASGQDEKLQVLTHPAWWVPQPMSPRQRVSRCIEGRAASLHHFYDQCMAQLGRQNVR